MDVVCRPHFNLVTPHQSNMYSHQCVNLCQCANRFKHPSAILLLLLWYTTYDISRSLLFYNYSFVVLCYTRQEGCILLIFHRLQFYFRISATWAFIGFPAFELEKHSALHEIETSPGHGWRILTFHHFLQITMKNTTYFNRTINEMLV